MKKGFTIIELIIVLAIMALLLGVGYTNFRDFATRQNLKTSQRLVYDYLQEAKSLAKANKKPEECIGTFEGWRFRILNRRNPAEIAIYHVCEDSGDTLYKSKELPGDMDIRYRYSSSILFLPLGGLTDIPTNRTYDYVRIYNRDFSNVYVEVRIYVIGTIDMVQVI